MEEPGRVPDKIKRVRIPDPVPGLVTMAAEHAFCQHRPQRRGVEEPKCLGRTQPLGISGHAWPPRERGPARRRTRPG